MPESKGRPQNRQPATRQSSLHLQNHQRRWWPFARNAGGFVVAVAALLAATDAIYGPIWPTNPEIVANRAEGSSPIPPFTIKNNSMVFSMRNARFTCYLNGASFKIGDEKGWVIGVLKASRPGDWWKKSDGTPIEILPTKAATYLCGPAQFLRDVELNHQQTKLRDTQVQVAVDYGVDFKLFSWSHHYESDKFTCDVIDNKCQWYTGEIVR